MSDEKALLAAIWAQPHEDTPRLVYADWLQENGGPAQLARAEFIRVQCELELLPTYDPRYDELEAREQALQEEWSRQWHQPKKRSHRLVEFSRGFPVLSLQQYSVKRLVKLTATPLRAAPLWRYHYGTTGRDLDALLGWRNLHRLTMFALRSPLPKGWATRLVECPGLRNVSELAFIGCSITPEELKLVLDAWVGRRLTGLWLNECPVGDEGIKVLARHPAAAGLRLLRVHTAGFTSRGAKEIADSEYLDRVRVATFGHNRIGTTGGRHLLRWRALPGIRDLHLMQTGISQSVEAKIDAVRKWPNGSWLQRSPQLPKSSS
ncbi:MAG: hypothetical protein C0467_11185 [Planctomycetaceae bacterium]|nr:hypothetical protein [Planctomycetaceae bacterium]